MGGTASSEAVPPAPTTIFRRVVADPHDDTGSVVVVVVVVVDALEDAVAAAGVGLAAAVTDAVDSGTFFELKAAGTV